MDLEGIAIRLAMQVSETVAGSSLLGDVLDAIHAGTPEIAIALALAVIGRDRVERDVAEALDEL